MSRSLTLLVIALAAFLAVLRLVPALASGSLFSTDTWPLFRGSNALLGGAVVWDDQSFDGYNNHWPGAMLLAASLSAVMGIETRVIFAYVLTAWLSLAFFTSLYALLRRFFSSGASALGAAAAGLTPSFAVFTSAPLKEVVAYPVMLTILALALREGARDSKDLAALAILSAGLVITHHLGTFMLIGFLAGIALARLTYWLKGLLRLRPCVGCLLVPTAALSAIFLIYFLVFGGSGLRGVDAWVPLVASYAIYFSAVYLGFLILAGVGRWAYATILAAAVTALAAVAAGGDLSVLPGVVVSSASLIWYVVPVAAYLVILLPGVRDVRIRVLVAGFGLFVGVNVAFVALGEPLFAELFHRFLNYVVFPIAVLVAYWVTRGGARAAAAVGAVALAGLSCVVVFAGLLGGWDVSSYWVYRETEVSGFSDIIALAGGSQLVGDEKVRYFAAGVARVDPAPVLKMLFLGEGPPHSAVFVLYAGNYVRGFVVGLSTYDIRDVLSPRVLSKVYDNGHVYALVGGGNG